MDPLYFQVAVRIQCNSGDAGFEERLEDVRTQWMCLSLVVK